MKLWEITATERVFVEAETAVEALESSGLSAKLMRASMVKITEIADAETVEPEWAHAGTMRDGTIEGWDLDALYAKAEAEDGIPFRDAVR